MGRICRWPDVRDPSLRQVGGRIAPAATVGLLAAAWALGISPDQAGGLAACGAFPATVVETAEGYRVPTTALSQVLGSAPGHRPGRRRGSGSSRRPSQTSGSRK
ncbi:MAG TPA: hypothetical protein VGG25_19120 [Streptosporangiaceae bacterium]|jgi:hypothetical protein